MVRCVLAWCDVNESLLMTGDGPVWGRITDMTPVSGSSGDEPRPGPIAVVGAGRMGSLLVKAFTLAGWTVTGPHGRGFTGRDASIVLLCVPDAAIAAAAQVIVDGPLVGHCSGATGLDVLGPRRGFSVHPVMTVTVEAPADTLVGAGAAVSATDPDTLLIARALATGVGMIPFDIIDADRVTYHAATAMAANFLVVLEESAAELIGTAHVDREVLLPLARAALDNWGQQGRAALTGPIARGDHAVVRAHRDAVAERAAHLLPMFDALATLTARLAGRHSSNLAGDPR